MEKWEDVNKMQFNMDMDRILHLGNKSEKDIYLIGDTFLGSSVCEQDLVGMGEW